MRFSLHALIRKEFNRKKADKTFGLDYIKHPRTFVISRALLLYLIDTSIIKETLRVVWSGNCLTACSKMVSCSRMFLNASLAKPMYLSYYSSLVQFIVFHLAPSALSSVRHTRVPLLQWFSAGLAVEYSSMRLSQCWILVYSVYLHNMLSIWCIYKLCVLQEGRIT